MGGSLKQGDPGVRLFDGFDRLPRRQYVVPDFANRTTDLQKGQAKLVPLYNIFASAEMASRSPVVASQLPTATWKIGVEDAQNWQVNEGDYLEIAVNQHAMTLPVQVVPYLAEGCIGYPVGQVEILHHAMPASVRKVAAPSIDSDRADFAPTTIQEV